jgi:hypothetical protein
MGILAKPFPEYGVTLQIFRGEINREAWMDYYARFPAESAPRFITWVDASADLSGIDLASGPELKRVVAAKLREAFGDLPIVSILVPGSPAQEAYVKFWCGFERAGETHPAESVIAPDLATACDLLGLPKDAAEKLAEAVEG